MFSVITEYTGFNAVRVDFVVRPRNGSGMISRIRSTHRTCRSGQAIAGDVSTAVIAGVTVTGSHLHVICNHAPGGPGCLTQWRRASSSYSCLTLLHSEKSVLVIGLYWHPYRKIPVIALSLCYDDQCLLLITEHLLWYF